MSTPDQPTPPTQQTTEVPGWNWTEADLDAIFASEVWFAKALPELIEQYRGKHVAIFGEQIIDADRDLKELGRRLDAKGDDAPISRLLIRYIPTEEEAMTGRW